MRSRLVRRSLACGKPWKILIVRAKELISGDYCKYKIGQVVARPSLQFPIYILTTIVLYTSNNRRAICLIICYPINRRVWRVGCSDNGGQTYKITIATPAHANDNGQIELHD